MIASRRSNGKLAAFDDATLEKYGYFIQLLNRFPAFYEVVHNDYHLNASKSGWSLTKVFFLFFFFPPCLFICRPTSLISEKHQRISWLQFILPLLEMM
jgi:hypothetical protein